LKIGAYRRSVARMTWPLIHRFGATGGGTPVNAYVLEGAAGTVVVDATLLVPDARVLRERVDALGKPLLGVVVTHAHPDHYGGLAELTRGLDVPVFATAGVIDVIRRDDAVKEQILRPMFGDAWAAERRFPDTAVPDGETVRLDGVALTVTDLGPGESPHDSVWTLAGDGRKVFSADVAYDRMHGYLADGFHAEWLANIARLRVELPPGTTLHPGHGEPCGLEVLDWQEGYIRTVLDAVREADWARPDEARTAAIERIRAYLPADELRFLVELSLEPLAARLGA
jgi:glyoxylase-like metal-dependent hydrolase (beta-lactamase superfamily II)